MESIFHRISVRKYKENEVEQEKIELLLRAAMAAPSACNQQPWEFYVIDSSDKRQQAIKNCMGQSAAKTSARLIAVVARTDNWHDHAKQVLREYPETPIPKKVKDYYSKVVTLDFLRGPVNALSVAKWGVTHAVSSTVPSSELGSPMRRSRTPDCSDRSS